MYLDKSLRNNFKKLVFFNPGYSVQLQNSFKIDEKLSLTLTPFIELDYDRYEEVGGAYFGMTYNFKDK